LKIESDADTNAIDVGSRGIIADSGTEVLGAVEVGIFGKICAAAAFAQRFHTKSPKALFWDLLSRYMDGGYVLCQGAIAGDVGIDQRSPK
jgi:hypothetical protein